MLNCPNCGAKVGLIDWGGWTFDLVERRLLEYPKIAWTDGEANIIRALIEARGEIMDKKALMKKAATKAKNTVIIPVQIYNIRMKLDSLIETVNQQGYRLTKRK